eukprot:359236-Chlamydomonas_euryale.AAC.4
MHGTTITRLRHNGAWPKFPARKSYQNVISTVDPWHPSAGVQRAEREIVQQTDTGRRPARTAGAQR